MSTHERGVVKQEEGNGQGDERKKKRKRGTKEKRTADFEYLAHGGKITNGKGSGQDKTRRQARGKEKARRGLNSFFAPQASLSPMKKS